MSDLTPFGKFVVGLLLLGALLLGMFGPWDSLPWAPKAVAVTVPLDDRYPDERDQTVYEDEPGWGCHAHNPICGATTR
jgi:hypothetical protein